MSIGCASRRSLPTDDEVEELVRTRLRIPWDIRAAYEMRKSGATWDDIGKQFGVSGSTVCAVFTGRRDRNGSPTKRFGALHPRVKRTAEEDMLVKFFEARRLHARGIPRSSIAALLRLPYAAINAAIASSGRTAVPTGTERSL